MNDSLQVEVLYPAIQPDDGEGLVKRKGVTARWGLMTAWSKAAARGQVHKYRITRPTRADERAHDREVHGHQGPGW
jgi:hypothetical protein